MIITLIELEKQQEQFPNCSDIENRLISALLTKQASPNGKSNAEISKELGISERYLYQIRTRKHVSEILLYYQKTEAKQLLGLAIEKSRQMLESDKTSDTAKVNLINGILKSNGLYKDNDSSINVSPVDKTVDIDALMVSYGIKQKTE